MPRRTRKSGPTDLKRFREETYQVALASILMRYDGKIAERGDGIAHFAADIVDRSVAEFIKRGWL